MLARLGTADLITVLAFSVSWQTIYYENANAIPSLSPINLPRLLMLPGVLRVEHVEIRNF